MKRRKVALDANIPERTVRMLQSGFKDNGFEFYWEPDFAASSDEDEFWARAFMRFGGQVVITGDKRIAHRLHQIAAFRECGLISFFCTRRWSEQDLAYKCGHLIRWWPVIAGMLDTAKPRDCWWVPFGLRGDFEYIPEQAGERRKKAG